MQAHSEIHDPDLIQLLALDAQRQREAGSTSTQKESIPAADFWREWQLISEPISRTEDVWVASNDGTLVRIRVYFPIVQTDHRLPLLVYAHGGGWSEGIFDLYDAPCCALANASSCTVLSVDHRHAPTFRFPSQLEDVLSALIWAFEHGEALNGDLTRILVGGDGIGGALAAAASLTFRESGLNFITHQLLIYPTLEANCEAASYDRFATGFLVSRGQMQSLWRSYLPDATTGTSMFASPLRAKKLNRLPATTIVTAQFDPARDDGESYASKLRHEHVPVSLLRLDDAVHGYLHLTGVLSAARQAILSIGDALRIAVHRTGTSILPSTPK